MIYFLLPARNDQFTPLAPDTTRQSCLCRVWRGGMNSSSSSSSSRSRRGPSRRFTTMSTVDSTPPEVSSRTIRYDTRCYFNVRSKANMSQLNLPHGNRQLKSVKTERKKNKSRKQICPEITVNSPGNPCSNYLSRKKGRATVGKICRERRF